MHVAEMGCPIGRENYDIIQVNETGTPFHAGKNHVDSPLESCRCVAKPERETTEPEDPLVGSERSFVPIFWAYRNLPISTIAVESSKYGGVSKGINAFVHPRKGVSVRNGNRVESPIVHAESQGTIRLGDQNDWGRPFRGCRLNYSLGEHFFNFPAADFPSAGTCPIGLGVYGPCTGHQINPVFGGRNRSQSAIPHFPMRA